MASAPVARQHGVLGRLEVARDRDDLVGRRAHGATRVVRARRPRRLRSQGGGTCGRSGRRSRLGSRRAASSRPPHRGERHEAAAHRSRYGTASLVARASVPPAAAPIAWPGAQARFESANTHATWSPSRSAETESSESAGVQNVLNAIAARIVTGTRTTRFAPATAGRRARRRRDEPDRDGYRVPRRSATSSHDRRGQASERGGGEEDRADPDGRDSEIREPQAAEHAQRPEEQGRQGDEPEPTDEALVTERGTRRGDRLPLAAQGRIGSERERRRRRARSRPTAVNTGPVPRTEPSAPSTGPNSAPAIATPSTDPISCPRRSVGASPTSHVNAAVHAPALAIPWMKPRDIERDDRVGEPEQHGRRRDDEQRGDRRRLGAEPRCGVAPGDAPDQRAERIRGLKHAGAGLGQPEIVDVPGKQRRQGGEEHRVADDDRAAEEEQPAHARTLLGHTSRMVATPRRASSAGASREMPGGPPAPPGSHAVWRRSRRARAVRRFAHESLRRPNGLRPTREDRRADVVHRRRRGPPPTSWTRPMRSASSAPKRSPVRK